MLTLNLFVVSWWWHNETCGEWSLCHWWLVTMLLRSAHIYHYLLQGTLNTAITNTQMALLIGFVHSNCLRRDYFQFFFIETTFALIIIIAPLFHNCVFHRIYYQFWKNWLFSVFYDLVKYSQEITLNINDFPFTMLATRNNGWKKCYGASRNSNFLNIRKIVAII